MSDDFSLFGRDLFDEALPPAEKQGKLGDNFIIPPFTVLDARQGYWQERKRAWLALGIQSELGRGGNLLEMSDTVLEPDPAKRLEMQRQRKLAKTFDSGRPGDLAAGFDKDQGETASLKGGLTFGTTFDPYRRAPTALSQKLAPGGGGGGAWLGGPKTASSANYQKNTVGEGLLIQSDSGNDPEYYWKKQEAEKALGRTLTTEEFQRDYYEGPDTYKSGTSIFDPVLCELAYRWFCPEGGVVIDPFAGGSVRGIVAALLGRRYFGNDLSEPQVVANREQAERICNSIKPTWTVGDSTQVQWPEKADLIFSCPPYGDLEVYSDDPRDLSTMTYEGFLRAYRTIIKNAADRLRRDRFACFVVGDYRDERGLYRNFVGETINAFQAAGCMLYNEAILVTSVGSLSIRVGKQFETSRKLGKTHQQLLCFVKGDGKFAAQACSAPPRPVPGGSTGE